METRSIEALNALLDSIAVDRELTKEHLMALMHLCSQQGEFATASVMGALRLLDVPDSVEKMVATGSRRVVYKVRDKGSAISLICRPTQRYCSCDRFVQVVMSDSITCEHVLAAQLSEALGMLKETAVSDSMFVECS
ncbi:hypothetical protein EDD21DRAFT_370144 [Dissophora ornata]|nr:hypothetical protein EDD21DRAFT_370144 [Dissophora ornata]